MPGVRVEGKSVDKEFADVKTYGHRNEQVQKEHTYRQTPTVRLERDIAEKDSLETLGGHRNEIADIEERKQNEYYFCLIIFYHNKEEGGVNKGAGYRKNIRAERRKRGEKADYDLQQAHNGHKHVCNGIRVAQIFAEGIECQTEKRQKIQQRI
jgi:hypothetical protein